MLKVSSSEDRSSVRNTVCLCAGTLPDLPTFACFSLVSDFQRILMLQLDQVTQYNHLKYLM